jgi:2'-5' RNA ligase
MPVLFLGLALSPSVKDTLLSYSPKQTRNLRPVSYELFHITLHYLGAADVDSVVSAVEGHTSFSSLSSFDLTIDSLGHFGRRNRPSVLWAGIQPSLELNALHQALILALSACGIRVDARPYHPHITLARGAWNKGLDDFTEQELERFFNQQIDDITCSVDSFVLFESCMIAGKRCYPVRHQFILPNK